MGFQGATDGELTTAGQLLDPETGESTTQERIDEHRARQLHFQDLNAGSIFCFGFSGWKHDFVRRYLASPGGQVFFVRSAADALAKGFNSQARLIVWGAKETEEVRSLARDQGVDLWRMEDGFLRSGGLGSDLTAPASLVVDTRGIYFDPRTESDLEHILENQTFTDDDRRRAAQLREQIVAANVSKYNVGDPAAVQLPAGHEKTVILAPGQVEDDASIQFGCVDVRTNAGLLRAIRENNPDAYVIFKPHPDVLSGNRKGRVESSELGELCNLVVEDASLAACLSVADEVHTMTSLVGFEALMRGLQVHAYGRPFYSGWGLTHDRHSVERRTRTLALDELVAGAYIYYPRYMNRRLWCFTTPERIVAELNCSRVAGRIKLPWIQRQPKRLWRWLRGLVHVR